MIMVAVYIAIGSNLGDRVNNIKKSIRYLNLNPRIKVQRLSRLYETLAQGGSRNQPKYFNAVTKIMTSIPPLELLKELKSIESKLKRKNTIHWGPRTIDLDILFYDDLIFLSGKLCIPHLLLHKRFFVLKPLSEIAPNFVHPLFKKNIRILLKSLGDKNGKKIIPFEN